MPAKLVVYGVNLGIIGAVKGYLPRGSGRSMGKGTNREVAESKADGIEEGIEQRIDSREIKMGAQASLIKIANTLLSKGTSIKKIAHLTGLTERDIKELLNNK